jgi:glutathione S-transferase
MATLYIGNRNYSSWSLRGWLLVRLSGLEFQEQMIPLYTPDTKAQVRAVSPSGFVPCLHHGKVMTWDSLAIAEYLHEQFPQAGIWPRDAVQRAHARSISAEMHSGFADLRRAMPMDIHASRRPAAPAPAVQANLQRIEEIWTDCRSRFGAGGDFLFGAWSGADCMYAPVVMRFRSYGVQLNAAVQKYVAAVSAQKDVAEWIAAARSDEWVIDWEAAVRAGVTPVAQRK